MFRKIETFQEKYYDLFTVLDEGEKCRCNEQETFGLFKQEIRIECKFMDILYVGI